MLFRSHEDVTAALLSLYCDLLELCFRIVRFHNRAFRSTFTTFEKEFVNVTDSIDLHSREVERAATIAGLKEANEIQAQTIVFHKGECCGGLDISLRC